MNRDTLALLLMFAALGLILGLAAVLVLDATVFAPPDVDTTIQVTGLIQ